MFVEVSTPTVDGLAAADEANAGARAPCEAMASFVSAHCVGPVCQPYHVRRRVDHGGGS